MAASDLVAAVEQDPAALAATVLDEEARRRARQQARHEPVLIADDLLPGVGGRLTQAS